MSNEMQSFHGLESWLAESAATESTVASSGSAAVTVTIRADLCHYNLRGNPSDSDFVSTAEKVTGVSLPLRANTVVRQANYCGYWLGPDEWLIVRPGGAEIASNTDLHLNDLSGGQLLLRLAGPAVESLLAKGCTLDLSSTAFAADDCAQTGLAKASVLIARVQETDEFEVIVRRSFSEYLMLWLKNAGTEFGIRFER